MNWIVLIIFAAIFYGLYNFFIKLSSGNINQIVGAVILQIVAAILGSLVLFYLRIINAPLTFSSKGIFFAVLAGIFVGLAEITSFFVFSKGIPASIGIPITIGGSVIVGSILGLVFLKESLNLLQFVAIAMIVTGIAILSIK